MMCCVLLGLSAVAIAHSHKDAPSKGDFPGARKTTVIQLPSGGDYFPILSPPLSATMRSGLVTLAPGKSVGRHPTGEFEEMVIPLEGEGEMDVTGKGKFKVKYGQVLYAPPGTEHDVLNIGSSPLRYIYVVAKVPTQK